MEMYLVIRTSADVSEALRMVLAGVPATALVFKERDVSVVEQVVKRLEPSAEFFQFLLSGSPLCRIGAAADMVADHIGELVRTKRVAYELLSGVCTHGARVLAWGSDGQPNRLAALKAKCQGEAAASGIVGVQPPHPSKLPAPKWQEEVYGAWVDVLREHLEPSADLGAIDYSLWFK